MKKYLCLFSLIIGLFLFPSLSFGQDFSRTMKQLLGDDYPKYQWLDYPVNNFGIATAYKGKKNRAEVQNFLCGTYKCLGIGDVPTDTTRWMQPNDFVEIGCGQELNAKVVRNKELVLNAVLPQIYSLIGISASAQRSANSTSDLAEVTVCDRRLQQETMAQYIRNLNQDTYGMQKWYNRDQLVLVVGDVVIKSMSVKIKAGNELKLGLDSKLQGRAEKVFGQGANFGVKLSKTGALEYNLTITQPVVAAVLPIRKGPTRSLSGIPVEPDPNSPWTGWVTMTIPLPRR